MSENDPTRTSVAERHVSLLREALATLDTWADVAPAISLRADIRAALATAQLTLASRQPVAYLHTLHYEPGAGELVRVELTGQDPWGTRGINYSAAYRVTTEPLFK